VEEPVTEQDPGEVARAIVHANVYMTLATADGEGRPWASPVFYATDGAGAFYWMSSPETTHSRNLAARPEVALVIFDSRAVPPDGEGVWLSATAAELTGEDIEAGLAVYPGPPERGGRRIGLDVVTAPSPYRLYRAVVTEASILCPREGPCAPHGLSYDHRLTVVL
jgi:nitroimidazol reductase NimA-like FMN-containing flavoprotein (pyridoxamine 5'-phosphate oxidase superfamily)